MGWPVVAVPPGTNKHLYTTEMIWRTEMILRTEMSAESFRVHGPQVHLEIYKRYSDNFSVIQNFVSLGSSGFIPFWSYDDLTLSAFHWGSYIMAFWI